MGSASRAGKPSEAVELVRAAIEHKASHLAPGARRSTLLALDVSNFGTLASHALVVAYLARYDDPKVEFNFAQTWIVGPTVASTIRVIAPTKSRAFLQGFAPDGSRAAPVNASTLERRQSCNQALTC